MESCPAPYEYRSLQSSTIRLLEIHSSTGHELICSLHHVDLRYLPPYQALSYTWGDPRPPSERHLSNDTVWDKKTGHSTKRLICDGRVLESSENLRRALFSFHRVKEKHKRGHNRIWVDAICINQKDKPEVNAQIVIMGNIYNGAECVFSWLGPSTKATKVVLGLLDRLVEQDRNQKKPLRFGGLEALGFSPQDWLLLYNFARRPWFERVWVVQEVVLAREIRIMWGTQDVVRDVLVKAFDIIAREDLWEEMVTATKLFPTWFKAAESDHATRPLGIVFNILCRDYIISYQNPLCLFKVGQAGKAKIRHDHVYGLLACVKALASPSAQDDERLSGLEDLAPDYSKELHQVYTDCARLFVKNGQHFMLFSSVDEPSRLKSSLRGKMPTWVPDFSMLREAHPLHTKMSHIQWNASNSYDYSSETFNMEASAKITLNGTLSLPGICVDHIAALASQNNGSFSRIESILSFLLETSRRHTNLHMVHLFDSLGRSLIAEGALEPGVEDDISRCTEFHDAFATWIGADIGDLYFGSKGFEEKLAEYDFAHTSNYKTFRIQELRNFQQNILRKRPTRQAYRNCFQSVLATIQQLHQLDNSVFPPVIKVAKQVKMDPSPPCSNDPQRLKSNPLIEHFNRLAAEVMTKRKLIRTSSGRIGIAPSSVRVADQVWIFEGAQIPYVLRPVGSSGHFELIGEAYVDGIMRGEAVSSSMIWHTVELV